MKARLLIILCFCGVLGVIGMVGYYRAMTQAGPLDTKAAVEPAVVRVANLTTESYPLTESFYGLIEANVRVDMAFQIVGRVMQLGSQNNQALVENQRVRKGQLLARLEPQRYEAMVQQAKAQEANAKAQMATASAEIASVNAELQDSKSELLRLQQLKYQNATTEREVERGEVRVKQAQAMLDAAKAKLMSAQASYQAARASAMSANVDLQDTVLRAPMDARVAAVPVELGQMVQPGQNIATLMDLSNVKLVIGVVERKVPLLREGQAVKVEVLALSSQASLLSDSESLGRIRRGRVSLVPPMARESSGLFNVEIELDNEDGLLMPGMIGKATILVTEQQGVAIPVTAAVRSGDRAWAFFVSPKYHAGLDLGTVGEAVVDVPATVAKKVWFDPIVFNNEHYIVTSVPDGADRLVIEGQNRLQDGQTVRVVEAIAGVSPAAQHH